MSVQCCAGVVNQSHASLVSCMITISSQLCNVYFHLEHTLLTPRPLYSSMLTVFNVHSACIAVHRRFSVKPFTGEYLVTSKLLRTWRKYCQSATDKMASNYPANFSSLVSSHIQVLGTGANELAPSFYLFTDSKRYLFNCGENLQRFRTEFRLPLTKLQSIFVTHVSWKNLGGLPGMAMSSRDQGITNLNLYGPELLEEFAEVTRYFVGRKKLQLVTPWSAEGRDKAKSEPQNIYEDENVKVRTVHLYSCNSSSPPKSDSDSSSDEKGSRSPKLKRRKVIRSSSNCTAAFVCKLCDVPGKFDAERAKELGVPPSPLYKKLRNGECVTSADGRIVHPHEVLGPPKIGPVMIVVECPDESYIQSLVSHPALQSKAFSTTNQPVELIVHMSPEHVFKNENFRKWMGSFSADTKHLILNKDMCSEEYALRRSLKIQFPLHLMNPSVYHPVVASQDSNLHISDNLVDIIPKDSVIYGRTLLKYHLKPVQKVGIDESSVLKPLAIEYCDRLKDIKDNPHLVDAVLESRQAQGATSGGKDEILKAPSSSLIPRMETSDDAIVTFLGTGSAAPTSYRNVTGILIQTTTSGNILFDCGEGSLSQIYRCFGKQTGDDIVRNITGVFVSHIHGDHHLGLMSILLKVEELNGGKLSKENSPLIIGPRIYGDWLKRYINCQQVSFRFVDCESLLESEKVTYVAKMLYGHRLQDIDFGTVPVIHCASAYGIVMKHSIGWTIVYSGDTRPCQELVRAGKGATLLIHEATFEDNMFEDAKEKLHCTFGESLKISDQMNPKFTLMTHFSSRYPRIPSVLMDDRVHERVGIAFDCMSVRLKELDTLHSYLPYMKKIFAQVVGSEDLVVNNSMKKTFSTDWDTEEPAVSSA